MKICIFLEEHTPHAEHRVPEFVLLVPSFLFLSVICVGGARGPAALSSSIFRKPAVCRCQRGTHCQTRARSFFKRRDIPFQLTLIIIYLYTTSPNHPTIPYQGAVIESGAIGGTCVNVGACSLLAIAPPTAAAKALCNIYLLKKDAMSLVHLLNIFHCQLAN